MRIHEGLLTGLELVLINCLATWKRKAGPAVLSLAGELLKWTGNIVVWWEEHS